MTTTQIADLVGLTEIAERCNVTKNVAAGWTRKHTFPPIRHKLAMGPMWDWNEVQEHLYGPDPRNQLTLAVPCAHCGGETICGDTEPITITLRCEDGHRTSIQLADMAIVDGPIQATVRTLKEEA